MRPNKTTRPTGTEATNASKTIQATASANPVSARSSACTTSTTTQRAAKPAINRKVRACSFKAVCCGRAPGSRPAGSLRAISLLAPARSSITSGAERITMARVFPAVGEPAAESIATTAPNTKKPVTVNAIALAAIT